MNPMSPRQQARSDERDNQRVFVFTAVAAVVVFIGALVYFYAVDQRGEGPTNEIAAPSAAMHRERPVQPSTKSVTDAALGSQPLNK